MIYTNDFCPVLMNAKAGTLHGTVGTEQLKRMAREVGFVIDVLATHSMQEMHAILERLVREEVPRVGIAGGDGTVEEAVQTLAYTDTALGILSQGTFNNFATSLLLPHNLPAALRVLHEGDICSVDLGRVKQRYFTESAGVGLFADGLALYGQGTNKNFLRGILAGMRLLLSFRAQEMRIILDDEHEHRERIVLCEVANTYRIAQAIPIAPNAQLDDGVFDIVLIGAIRRRELLPYLRALRAQMHLDLPKVTTLRARRSVRIETLHRPRRNIHSDDTVVGVTSITMEMHPGALRVCTARKS